ALWRQRQMQTLCRSVLPRHVLTDRLGHLELLTRCPDHHHADPEFPDDPRDGHRGVGVDLIETSTRKAPRDHSVTDLGLCPECAISLLSRGVEEWLWDQRHVENIANCLEIAAIAQRATELDGPPECRLHREQSNEMLARVREVSELRVLLRSPGEPLL